MMDKYIKYSIIIGFILMFTALILSLGDLDRLISVNNPSYDYSEHIVSEDIERIIIDTRNMRVNIRPHDADYIKVLYPENDDFSFTAFEYGHVFSLTINDRSGVSLSRISFNLSFYVPTITVNVPRNMILSYDITTTNAYITASNLIIDTSTFRTGNSRVDLRNITSDGEIDVTSTNGRLSLDNITAEELRARTTNSRINADNINATGVSITNSNGRIVANNINAFDINLTSSNSAINFSNIDASIIDIANSNGRISGDIARSKNEFQKDIRTSNGRVIINGERFGTTLIDSTVRDYRINVRNSNGRIDIEFK